MADIAWLAVYLILTCLIVVAILRHEQGGDGEPRILKSQPIVGVRRQLRASTIAGLRSIIETSKWTLDGYEKYSKFNQPFVVPSLDRGPMIVIPREQLKLYGQPENVLDMRVTAETTIQFKYTCPDTQVRETRLEIGVIRKQLTRNLNNITPRVAQELDVGFRRTWGLATEWKTVNLWNTARKIIMGAANAAFSGDMLCRNTVFLDRVESHTMTVFTCAFIISCLPTILQPVVGFLVSKLVAHRCNRAMEICMPYIMERLDKTAKLMKEPDSNWTPPQDGLQWLIEESYASPLPDELIPERVWHRLLIMNNVSLLTTSYTAQNVLLDLFSSDPSSGYGDILRDEAAKALESTGGVWTHESVGKLRLLDSAIRESMRVSPMGPLMLARTVMHPDGINFEGCGIKADYKTVLTVPMEAIHYDEDVHPDARRYNPFRFAAPGDEVSGDKEAKQKLIVSLDDGFLSFGTGRWACPGRFFASMEMKIFVANVLLNYEVEHLSKRPQPWHVLWMNLTPLSTIRVRRRAPASKV